MKRPATTRLSAPLRKRLEDLHIDENSRVNPKDIEDEKTTTDEMLVDWTISLLEHYIKEAGIREEYISRMEGRR